MRGCSGRNEIFIGTVESRDQCRRTCDENLECLSFEWWGDLNPHPRFGPYYCQVSSSCTYERSKKTIMTHKSILYIKGNVNTTQLWLFTRIIFLKRQKNSN